MSTDFTDDDALVSDSDLIGFYKPDDIVTDPQLTLARKRQLLAYWASDIHAVRSALGAVATLIFLAASVG